MRFALEGAGVGIWDADFRTGAMRWSAILEAQYGLAAGTFGGTTEAAMASVHADDRGSLQAAITAATSRGGDFSTEYRVVRPDARC